MCFIPFQVISGMIQFKYVNNDPRNYPI